MASKPRWPVKLTPRLHRELDLTLSSPSAPNRKEILLNRKTLRITGKIKKEPGTQAEAGEDAEETNHESTSKPSGITPSQEEKQDSDVEASIPNGQPSPVGQPMGLQPPCFFDGFGTQADAGEDAEENHYEFKRDPPGSSPSREEKKTAA